VEPRLKLIDLARVLRSKNAGPSTLTLDMMFADRAAYDLACASPALCAEWVAQLYRVDATQVRVIHFLEALAIKISLPRPIAGSPGDSDVYGAQQHGPLLEIEL
jgi:hypothetical protein